MVTRMVRFLMMFTAVLALAACGGGGGGTTAGDQPAKVAGAVEFPAASPGKQTAKQVNAVVTTVVIKVFSVDTGKEVTEAVAKVNDTTTGSNSFTYSVENLPPGKNYLFKAIRGSQVVRRYIPSTVVISGANVFGQTVDSVSTATVIIIQTKLGIGILGETTLPTGVTTASIDNLQPKYLDSMIRIEILNGTASANATLVNSVKTLIAASSDPVKDTTITQQAGTAASGYTPPATTADQATGYVSQAQASLARQDVANASIAFEAALVADPANKDANFGGALTKIVMLIDDPKVKDIFLKWGVISPSANQVLSHASPIGNPFQNWTSAFHKVPSTGLGKSTAKSAASGQDAAMAVISSFNMMRGTLPKFTPTGSVAKSTAKTAASTVIPTTAPSVSEMQVTLSGSIIPALKEALARLKKVEGTGYKYNMTKTMQGNPSGVDIVMDDGEIYALETAINAFLCVLNVGVSYDLDVYDYDGNGTRNDYNKVSQDPLKTINQSSFFTLKSTGTASMQAGLMALQDAVANLEKAYGVLKLRTANQTAAGQGSFDLTNMTARDKTDFEKFLGYAKKAVAGQTDILYNNDTKTIAVNITKFFTSPLTRSNAPTLGYDVQPDATLSANYGRAVAGERTYGTAPYTWAYTIDSEIVPTSDIPDYTLNGILPSNSATNNVAGFNGILPVMSGKLLIGANGDQEWNFINAGADVYYLNSTGQTSIPITVTGPYGIYTTYNYTYNYVVKKIDVATGAVVKVADISTPNWINRLVYYNGAFYAVQQSYTAGVSAYGMYPVTQTGSTWSVSATPNYNFAVPNNAYVSSVTANGTDIYYSLSTWNQLTYTSSTDIRKLSNLTSDSLLISTPEDYLNVIGFANGYLYTGTTNSRVEKRNPVTGAVLASYGGTSSSNVIVVGGYIYKISDGKLIKYAGTPSGGTAKAVGK